MIRIQCSAYDFNALPLRDMHNPRPLELAF
jgi:hypothetical protein